MRPEGRIKLIEDDVSLWQVLLHGGAIGSAGSPTLRPPLSLPPPRRSMPTAAIPAFCPSTGSGPRACRDGSALSLAKKPLRASLPRPSASQSRLDKLEALSLPKGSSPVRALSTRVRKPARPRCFSSIAQRLQPVETRLGQPLGHEPLGRLGALPFDRLRP